MSSRRRKLVYVSLRPQYNLAAISEEGETRLQDVVNRILEVSTARDVSIVGRRTRVRVTDEQFQLLKEKLGHYCYVLRSGQTETGEDL